MNTKKTPKRDQREKKLREAHLERVTLQGGYLLGCANKEIAFELTHALTNWPFLEDSMVDVLRILLGDPNEDIASTVFNALVSQNSRITLMQSLLEDPKINENRSSVYDDILAKFKELNSTRNHYVHWFWYTHTETEKVFIAPNKQGTTLGLSFAKEIEAVEIKNFTGRCLTLQRLIAETVNKDRLP